MTPPSSDSGSPSPPPSCPSRKRPRSETSSEERKEARAHRNRIAAQNSRDRRKAQFAFLERRVAELEEENRALRAARGVPLLPLSASTAQEEHRRLEASARERENEELRERIRTLERGWDAVLQALAAHGLTPAPQPTTPTPAPAPPESARHLARTHDPDDAAIEHLFMEILAPLPAPATPSPAAATAPRSAAQTAEARLGVEEVAPTVVPEAEAGLGSGSGGDVGAESAVVDLERMAADEQGWDSGLEMQRILASLGVVGEEQQGPTDLELELGWTTGTGIGVF
ncbi:hypothetical protein C0993_005912 [Termitomyces sp. T159_Od127]|nr:hypothetical protein C0993_005912 [Termitomyces sp. T159_Od127]